MVVLIHYLPHNRLEEIGGLAGLRYIDPPADNVHKGDPGG